MKKYERTLVVLHASLLVYIFLVDIIGIFKLFETVSR